MDEQIERGYNIQLEVFVSSFVLEAETIAKFNPTLSDFYKKLDYRIASILYVPVNLVSNLHNPFHWEFFRKDTDSCFRLEDPVNHGEVLRVSLCRQPSFNEKGDLISRIFQEYSEYFKSRINISYL